MTKSRSPEAIEDEIELTRSRIEDRLEMLSHNVNPANLIAKALGTDTRSLPDTLNKPQSFYSLRDWRAF